MLHFYSYGITCPSSPTNGSRSNCWTQQSESQVDPFLPPDITPVSKVLVCEGWAKKDMDLVLETTNPYLTHNVGNLKVENVQKTFISTARNK